MYDSAYDYLLAKPLGAGEDGGHAFKTDGWTVKLVDGWREHKKHGIVIYWAKRVNDDVGVEYAIICRSPDEEAREYWLKRFGNKRARRPKLPDKVSAVMDMRFPEGEGPVGYVGESFIKELNKQLADGFTKKKFKKIIDVHYVHVN